MALAFAAEHAEHMRYVAAGAQWMIREPAVWREDNTLRVFTLTRKVCRAAAAACSEPNASMTIAAKAKVAAVEFLARSDERLAAPPDIWDADPWLLNTTAGVVDLHDGSMREHRADDYFTKITAAAPGGACPLWLAFLDKITGGNVELQEFLQRVVGYSLTGSTREHALFFGYGGGANGKGTFLNTITSILGKYATPTAMETLTESKHQRHATELADLHGARLVPAQETENGRAWNETRLKALTGGDPIKARFMCKDFFEYTPQFKLFVCGNNKPSLKSVDEAIRRRLQLIPFSVTIPAAERDKDLSEKLRAEWGGILVWAIAGCLEWQRIGLAPPDVVSAATEEYFRAEDSIELWMNECCVRDKSLWGGTTPLFKSWSAWADDHGEQGGSCKAFSQALAARGLTLRHNQRTRAAGFFGLGLRPEHQPADGGGWRKPQDDEPYEGKPWN